MRGTFRLFDLLKDTRLPYLPNIRAKPTHKRERHSSLLLEDFLEKCLVFQ